MVSISVSELKARLSEHLRRVKGGETVLVTERGRPIAQLRPPPAEESADAELQALVERGIVRRGRGPVNEQFWDLPRPEDPNGTVLQALLEERRESGR